MKVQIFLSKLVINGLVLATKVAKRKTGVTNRQNSSHQPSNKAVGGWVLKKLGALESSALVLIFQYTKL